MHTLLSNYLILKEMEMPGIYLSEEVELYIAQQNETEAIISRSKETPIEKKEREAQDKWLQFVSCDISESDPEELAEALALQRKKMNLIITYIDQGTPALRAPTQWDIELERALAFKIKLYLSEQPALPFSANFSFFFSQKNRSDRAREVLNYLSPIAIDIANKWFVQYEKMKMDDAQKSIAEALEYINTGRIDRYITKEDLIKELGFYPTWAQEKIVFQVYVSLQKNLTPTAPFNSSWLFYGTEKDPINVRTLELFKDLHTNAVNRATEKVKSSEQLLVEKCVIL